MLYLLKVYVLAAAIVFAMSGMVLAALAGWRVTQLTIQSRVFANSFANSRKVSRRS